MWRVQFTVAPFYIFPYGAEVTTWLFRFSLSHPLSYSYIYVRRSLKVHVLQLLFLHGAKRVSKYFPRESTLFGKEKQDGIKYISIN